MRKLMVLFVLITLMVTVWPATHTKAQNADPATYMPYFGEGAAVIRRPDGEQDFYFVTQMSANGDYVVGLSGTKPTKLYIWDIRELADEVMIPTPQEVPLNVPSLTTNQSYYALLAIIEPTTALVKVGPLFFEVDIERGEIVDTLKIDDALLIEQPDNYNYRSMLVQGTDVAMVDVRFDTLLVWDTVANKTAYHKFEKNVEEVVAFNGGWLVYGEALDAAGHTELFFCDRQLTTCHYESIEGELAFIDGNRFAFGTIGLRPENDIQTPTYYRFEDGLIPVESFFPNLPDDFLPMSLSPDGQYLVVLGPRQIFDDTGLQAPRAYYFWQTNGLAPLDFTRPTGLNLWFGDHFFASGSNLYSAATPAKLDEFQIYELANKQGLPWLSLFDYLYTHPEIDHLQQLSTDGKHLFYLNGGTALVWTIKYQRVDDLPHIGEPLFSMERGTLNKLVISSDGASLATFQDGIFHHWDVVTGGYQSLNLAAYLPADEKFTHSLILRTEDAFLQLPYFLLRISLEDLQIIEEIAVEDGLKERPGWAFGIHDGESLVQNGEFMGALYDHQLVVWSEEEIWQASFGDGFFPRPIRLYPRRNGWLIYEIDNRQAPGQHYMETCALDLSSCQRASFAGQLAALYDEDIIIGGNSTFLFIELGFPPTYWRLAGDSTTSIPPIINFPAENYIPADFHGDFAIVAAPHWDIQMPRHYEIWSVSQGKPLPRLDVGYWQWWGKYVISAKDGLIKIIHLADGRFTVWGMSGDLVSSIQIPTQNQNRMLIVSRDKIEVRELIE